MQQVGNSNDIGIWLLRQGEKTLVRTYKISFYSIGGGYGVEGNNKI